MIWVKMCSIRSIVYMDLWYYLNGKCKANFFTVGCCIKIGSQNSKNETSQCGIHQFVVSIKHFFGVHIQALD